MADSARGELRVTTVHMTSTSANPPVTWIDRVVLTKRAGHFVIDDIEYGGAWDFANKGSRRTSLVSALATPP